jgi:hypothetical protein
MAKKTEPTERKEKHQADPARLNGVAVTIAIIFICAAVLGAILMDNYGVATWILIVYATLLTVIRLDIMLSLKIADQWEKAIVLRLGKFHGLRGPGMFWILPVVDVIAKWIDHRVMVTPFNAEKTLTKDPT